MEDSVTLVPPNQITYEILEDMRSPQPAGKDGPRFRRGANVTAQARQRASPVFPSPDRGTTAGISPGRGYIRTGASNSSPKSTSIRFSINSHSSGSVLCFRLVSLPGVPCNVALAPNQIGYLLVARFKCIGQWASWHHTGVGQCDGSSSRCMFGIAGPQPEGSS